MRHKEQLIELATLVIELNTAAESYADSDRLTGQERLKVLCEIQDKTFTKAKEVLAAANLPKQSTVYEFQERIKEWADAFFTLESGRLGNTVLLQEALDDFRFIWKHATVPPFLKCLRFWAKERGLSFDYGIFRSNGLVRRAIIIRPLPSNN